MSSKRGRKRNDNLPPNRARDVQRAFRARRAAHLQALEQRVSELEEENSCLRQALNLPQANRPPLGKGPTGKDKPKSYDNHGHALPSSRSSSSPDSPESMRDNSASPVLISATLPPRAAVQEIENGTGPWGQTIVMTEEVPQYHLPPMSAPPSLQSTKSNPYPPPYPPSRSSSLAPMYMYDTTERHNGVSIYEQQQRSHSYSSQPHQPQPTYADAHEVAPAGALAYTAYPSRRATADFTSFQHLQSPGAIRLPSPPRGVVDHAHDPHGHHSQHDPHAHHRNAYTPDGRIIS
ncbi:hypothetical protein DFH07DRAFT_1067356 [Mycena maculata]|uniref:BZIP domain-containing protein n=1 Tax=Mycena maculata TaxID=230809 RepID=A0AAD7MMD1_9AGAR|nr:hypothetical protein DFH07DRAFT_1067356 [Mycena maculata]